MSSLESKRNSVLETTLTKDNGLSEAWQLPNTQCEQSVIARPNELPCAIGPMDNAI